MANKKRHTTQTGKVQKLAQQRLTNDWQTVTQIWEALTNDWTEDPPLARMRVANALRGLHRRRLIRGRQRGKSAKAPWEYQLVPAKAPL